MKSYSEYLKKRFQKVEKTRTSYQQIKAKNLKLVEALQQTKEKLKVVHEKKSVVLKKLNLLRTKVNTLRVELKIIKFSRSYRLFRWIETFFHRK